MTKYIDYKKARWLNKKYGDAFYIYDEARFERNFRKLEDAFRRVYDPTVIAYSYKTNYTPAICEKVDQLGGLAEIVSSMEYEVVKALNIRGDRVVFNGPCKDFATIEGVLVNGGVVNLDSLADLEIVQSVARKHPAKTLKLGIRCNLKDKQLPFSRFGIASESEEFSQTIRSISQVKNLVLAGLHCHYPIRNIESFRAKTDALLRVSDQIWKGAPEFLNIGGGFAGEMPEALKSQFSYRIPSYSEYAACAAGLIWNRFRGEGVLPKLLIEPGTAVVADTMSFVARVTATKQVRGRNIAICRGSVFNVSPTAKSIALPVQILTNRKLRKERNCTTDIVGYTCIESDYLARDVPFAVQIDDYVVLENVGSYSVVMKPPFILPNVSVLRKDLVGRYKLIKRAEAFADLFRSFTVFRNLQKQATL